MKQRAHTRNAQDLRADRLFGKLENLGSLGGLGRGKDSSAPTSAEAKTGEGGNDICQNSTTIFGLASDRMEPMMEYKPHATVGLYASNRYVRSNGLGCGCGCPYWTEVL